MGEREYWQNVYPHERVGHWTGRDWPSAARAQQAANTDPQRPLYRIHVRLKPEGAPRRYASEGERLVWQDDPDWARGVIRSRSHEVAERMFESRAGMLRRTQKIEGSAS